MRTSNKVFTTGAHLEAMFVLGQWRWIVVGFEDDTFGDDGELVNIYSYADTEEELFYEDDEE